MAADRRTAARLCGAVARWEPLLLLPLAPLFIFPRVAWLPWLLAAVALLWLCRWLGRGRLTVRTPLDVPLLTLSLAVGVSAWATYDLRTSFPKLCGVALGLATFYALVNALDRKRALWAAAGLLLAGGVAVAGVSLVGTRWGGNKVPLLLPTLTPLYDRFPLLLQGLPRAEEGFNANQVAGTLTLFVPLTLALLFYRLRRPARQRRWVLSTLGLAGAATLMLLVLLLTQSRMGYVATGLALLLLLAGQGRRSRLVAVALLLAGAGLLLYYGPQAVGQALFGVPGLEALPDETSWAGRVEIWGRAWRVLQDHPLTGIGFDTLFPVIHARYPTFRIPAGQDVTHAHNMFLQVGLDLGLPGLGAFAWLLVALAGMLLRVWRRAEEPGYRALAAGLGLGLLAHLTFGLADAVDLGAKPGVFVWVYFGLGAALWVRVEGGERMMERGEGGGGVRRPSFVSLLSILAVALLLVWGYWQMTRLQRWRALVEADLANWQALAQKGPQAVAPSEPGELLRTTRADLQGLQAELSLPLALAPHLGWLPRYGPDLRAAPALLESGLALASAGEGALDALAPLLEPGPEGQGGLLERAIPTLQAAEPRLRASLATLEATGETQRAIATAELSPPLQGVFERLDRARLLLENGLRGALALPELLGASGSRTYLILVQNDDELRPTGGFITGVARLVLDGGRVVELSFQDSYGVDSPTAAYPAPPRPLREIMGAEMWLVRDSNWSPDLPTSARTALELYRLYDSRPVEGVVAIDQQALQILLGALEPLQILEYPAPVTGANVIRAIRRSWAPQGEGELTAEWRAHHKDFLGRLLTAAVNRVQNEPRGIDPWELGWALLQALEQKHLFVYLPGESPVAELLEQTGWDGALQSPAGDYLMVVDSNVGFNKANPYVAERIEYTVDLRDPARPRATLALTHRHDGPDTGAPCRPDTRYDPTYEEMMQRCYWDYVRVYVPGGSRPLQATPHPVPGHLLVTGLARPGPAELLADEAGKRVLASLLVLAPGESLQTHFLYALPPDVLQRKDGRWHYRLYVQKQGGTAAHPLQVTLLLPADARDVTGTPPPEGREGNLWRHERALETDLTLDVWFHAPSAAP